VAFERAFERSGIPHYDSGIRWARLALDLYTAANRPAPVPVPKPRPDIQTQPQPDDPEPQPDPAPRLPVEQLSPWRRVANAIGALGLGAPRGRPHQPAGPPRLGPRRIAVSTTTPAGGFMASRFFRVSAERTYIPCRRSIAELPSGCAFPD
jgi:hypothetical protein